MNLIGVKAIFIHEMDRFRRTLLQSLASPIITTSLYFIVFGTAIGSRIKEIDGVNYGSYIVPGMIMLTILTQALSNASFAIYFQKFSFTIFELQVFFCMSSSNSQWPIQPIIVKAVGELLMIIHSGM